MKVVIDTNVFVSSFFGGNPRRIIDLWKSGDIVLCLSAEIIEEYTAVLERLGLGGEGELKELLDLFAGGRHILFSADPPRLKVVKSDPADDKFVGCAVALKADAIVTGDKTLAAVRNYMGIKILGPGEFLRLFGSSRL